MIPLFIGLTLVNLLGLAVAGALGYMSRHGYDVRGMHVLAGALSTMLACAMHCIVFTYFIATAKWVRHAVMVKHLDDGLITPTKSFRMQAFPGALIAMASVFVTAVIGAMRDSGFYPLPRIVHHSLAIGAFVINVGVAFLEYRAIARNGRLIDGILDTIQRSNPADAPGQAEIV